MATDLELAVATLVAKQAKYDLLWNYYQGAHPLVYNRKRLEEIFSDLNARFTQNWCAVVVDAVNDRVQLEQVIVNENDAATQQLDGILQRNDLLLEADDTHLAALVCGESYIIAWPDEAGLAEAYYNDPRNVHLFYEAANPRTPRFGAKWFVDDDQHRRLTLYYPDRLEYYRSQKPVTADGGEAALTGKVFDQADAPQVNPYGLVPVFHFRRDRRAILSELQNAIEPQDAINKLLSDMMVAAEYGAFKQRYIISHAEVKRMKNAPNLIWDLPGGDGTTQPTQVGEFSATDLDNYLAAIDKLAVSIGIITRTPKHYFFAQGGDPSGEALIAMEAPLNHKAEKYIERFRPVWARLCAFLLKIEGVTVDATTVYAQFDDPETVQPLTQSIIRQNAVSAGIPLLTQLRDEGWTEQDLAQMQDDKAEEQQAQQQQLGAALTNAMRQFDQGDQGNQNGDSANA